MSNEIDVECIIGKFNHSVGIYDNVGDHHTGKISIYLDEDEPYIAEQVKSGNHMPLEIWCGLNGYNLVRVVESSIYD